MQDDWDNELDYDEFDETEDFISKSQIKRELNELKDLGRELIALPKDELLKLDLPENLQEAVLTAHGLQKGALKRQTGYVGGLVAKSDYESIKKQLSVLKQPQREAKQRLHQLEDWRDRLLAGDNLIVTELHNQFEDFDGQHVRQLVRNAKREAQQNQPPKSARLLFKYLQQLSD